jgi:hypothetical protein
MKILSTTLKVIAVIVFVASLLFSVYLALCFGLMNQNGEYEHVIPQDLYHGAIPYTWYKAIATIFLDGESKELFFNFILLLGIVFGMMFELFLMGYYLYYWNNQRKIIWFLLGIVLFLPSVYLCNLVLENVHFK